MNVWLLLYLIGARHDLKTRIFLSFIDKKPNWGKMVEKNLNMLTSCERYGYKSLAWLTIQWMAVPCLLDCGSRAEPMTPSPMLTESSDEEISTLSAVVFSEVPSESDISSHEDTLTCSICVLKIRDYKPPICHNSELIIEEHRGRNIVTLPCGHLFHRSCLEAWMRHNNACPNCRAKINWQQMI
jgi:hypothetical protein